MALQSLNKKLERMDRSRSYAAPRRRSKKWVLKLFLFLIILAIAIYLPVRSMYSSYKLLKVSANQVSEGLKNNNLDQMKKGVVDTRVQVESIKGSLNWLFYLGFIPFAGGYYTDARHFVAAADYELKAAETMIQALEPYKNEIGFTGQPIPGQDRISQVVKIMDKALPQIDKIEPQLKAAADEVASIDVSKYPEKYGSTPVRSRVDTAKNFITGAHYAVTKAKPALEVAPSALGQPSAKTYLMLFQNDKELRATGGFLTAYAFLTLDKGHLSTTKSDDIYRLDEKLLQVCLNKICPLTPPAPIVAYLPEANGKPRTAWSMRDSNISPDLPTSMKQFESMYALLGEGVPFDGIITIDTQVVEELIAITGPVDVFGTTYSANTDPRCNCPNVIYELENYAEIAAKGQADRKAVLGTLMQQILGRVLGAENDKLPEFINAGVRLANDKHMMFYMHDPKTQQALSELGWTGQIQQTASDYLHINDSNFAGGKSNLYVDEKVTYEATPGKTDTKIKLTIEYKNPQPFNIWLNGINRDYVRVYVPKGSTLTASKGSDNAVNTLQDETLNKTYFEAFIQVRPQNSRVLSFEYTIPYVPQGKEYQLVVQKQPGAKDHQYTIKINGSTKETFTLNHDKDLLLNL